MYSNGRDATNRGERKPELGFHSCVHKLCKSQGWVDIDNLAVKLFFVRILLVYLDIMLKFSFKDVKENFKEKKGKARMLLCNYKSYTFKIVYF